MAEFTLYCFARSGNAYKAAPEVSADAAFLAALGEAASAAPQETETSAGPT